MILIQPTLYRQLAIVFWLYVGQINLGYGLGWSAPILPKLDNTEETPLPRPVTTTEASWIASLVVLGQIIGPYLTGYLSNVKGRRPCLLLSGILVTISFVILASAKSLPLIYVARIIGGLGTGIIQVLNIVYLGEIASTEIRGLLLTTLGIFNTAGTLGIYIIGPYASYDTVSYIGVTLGLIQVVGVIFVVPESPVFLAMKGRNEEAKVVLETLGRTNDIDKFQSTKTNEVSDTKSAWVELFKVKSNRRAFLITCILFICTQSSGAMVVIFFTTTIFTMSGSSLAPHVSTIVVGATQLVSSFVAPLIVERFGRKLLLLVSTPISFLSLVTLGIFFYLNDMEYAAIESIKWLPLVSLIIFFLAFNAGFAIIPGTLTGELFQTSARSLGSSLSISIGWICCFIASTAFGYMINVVGPYVIFWAYSIPCFVAFIFTIFFVPETKGKTFAEIQEMLSK